MFCPGPRGDDIIRLRHDDVITNDGCHYWHHKCNQTFYRWRAEYGGLRVDQARRLKQLETENSRLKRAVAELTLDNQILKEATEGSF